MFAIDIYYLELAIEWLPLILLSRVSYRMVAIDIII